MHNNALIECPSCECKVSSLILASKEYGPTEENDPVTVLFLECPICHDVMVGFTELIQTGVDRFEQSRPIRLWPAPKEYLHDSIPSSVRTSVEEGRKCFKAKAYAACAVMCGRSLEAICSDQGCKERQLAKGLKELKDKGIIDGRLSEWGQALRERRNIGAHATEEIISKEDARDVLDFTTAICEYVYVLTKKYEEFKDREKKRKSEK